MQKRDWIGLSLIIIGALLIRFVLMSKHYAVGFDEVNYLKLAASGRINGLNHVLHTYWSPLYPAAVALFSYIVPDFELAGRLVQILSSIGVILVIFFFAKDKFDKKIAFAAALLLAFFTLFARYSVKAEADIFYTFIALIGILSGWFALEKKKLFPALAAGVCFGMAYLARPEGIGFLGTYLGAVFVVLIYQIFTKTNIVKTFLIILLAIVGFSLLFTPYFYFLHRETGVWTISTKGTVNQQGSMYVEKMSEYKENPFHVVNDDNTKLMQDEIYHIGNFVNRVEEEGKPVVEVRIFDLLKKMIENFYKIITEAMSQVLTVPLLMLFGLGLFGQIWKRERTLLNLYLMCYIAFFWFVLIPAFHINLRYFMPVLPIAFIWIADGVIKFIDWGTDTLKENIAKWPKFISPKVLSIIFVTVVISVGTIFPELAKRLGRSKYAVEEYVPAIEQKQAGLWLRKNGVKSPIVMAYNHAVGFYAGNYEIKESVEIPENKIDRVVAYARNRGVNYLVLDDRYRMHHPLIAHVYDNQDVPPDLKLIHEFELKNGLKTHIFQIMKKNE